MTLKFMLDTIEGLAEGVASMYEKTEDGKFRLDVEGAVPREKLEEFRNTNISLMKNLESFKGVDVKKYEHLLGIEKKLDEKTLVDAGKVDEVVQSRIQSMRTEHEATVSALNSSLEMSNKQLETLLIDSAVRVKALELGALPTAVDDVMLRAKTSFKIIDGVATPHVDGKPVYGKDGINAMGVDEWITNLSKSAPHLFGQTQGGGASGSGSPRRNGGVKLSSIQKISSGLSQK